MRGEEIAYLWYGDKIRYIDVGRYPDGSPYVKEQDPTEDEFIERVLLRPRDSSGLLGGLFWIESLIERGHKPPELVLPCMFGQRQDRINPTGDVLFTVKSVARIINSLNLPKVMVFDPHSEATPACIDRVDVVHVDELFSWAMSDSPRDYRAVVAPDAGASKRAQKIADLLKLPLKQAKKKRDVSTGKLTGFELEDCTDLFRDNEAEPDCPDVPKLLVIDDLCDGGGTFVGLGQEIDAAGFDADLWVTHGLFTKGTRDLNTWYQDIYCTDSVVTPRPDVRVFSPAEHILIYGDL